MEKNNCMVEYIRVITNQNVIWILVTNFDLYYVIAKMQQTKMLVRCQIFGDLFLFGLVWQYSSIQKNIMKVGSKPWLLTCISNITLSLPSLYFSESKRELNFCNGYLSLLYFWIYSSIR